MLILSVESTCDETAVAVTWRILELAIGYLCMFVKRERDTEMSSSN